MMRTSMGKAFRIAGASLFPTLLALALSLGLVLGAPCAFAETRNVNPNTGYGIVILDEADLLSDTEEQLLVEDMRPITAYGNVAFWSTNARASNEIEQARLKRKELFDYSSATIFVINMANRKLTIQSYGKLYSGISDSRARSITDNVSSYATRRDYYTAASRCYFQINAVMEGVDIPEPMKLTGYAVLSAILGFTIILIVAFSSKFNPLRAEPEEISGMHGEGEPGKEGKRVIIKEEEYSTSSGGGGGGCGGGGGGCGGGGCGGGGSSGF